MTPLGFPFSVETEFPTPTNKYDELHVKICRAQTEAKVLELLTNFFTCNLHDTSMTICETVEYLTAHSILPLTPTEDYVESRGDDPIKPFVRYYPRASRNLEAKRVFKTLKNKTKVFNTRSGVHKTPLLSLLAMRAHFKALELLLPLFQHHFAKPDQVDCRKWTVLHHLAVLPLNPIKTFREIAESFYPHEVASRLIEAGAPNCARNQRGGTPYDLFLMVHPMKIKQIPRDGWSVSGLVATRKDLLSDWATPYTIDLDRSYPQVEARRLVEEYEARDSKTLYLRLENKPGIDTCAIANCDIPAGVVFSEYGGVLTRHMGKIDISQLHAAPTHQMSTGIKDSSNTKLLIDSIHLGSNGGFLTDGAPHCITITVSNYKGAKARVFLLSLMPITKGTVVTMDYGGSHYAKDIHIETQMIAIVEAITKYTSTTSKLIATLRQSQAYMTRGFNILSDLETTRMFSIIRYLFNTPSTLIDLVTLNVVSIKTLQILYQAYSYQLPEFTQETTSHILNSLQTIQESFSNELWILFLKKFKTLKSREKARNFLASFLVNIANNAKEIAQNPNFIETLFPKFETAIRAEIRRTRHK
ncbi:MAG: hypothetical protein P0S95_01550 [Rhabdochlamydiaceae bacterium]|nr:hypothetical protein [Candidatus Amphrikana amoebophyrae]